MAYLGFDSIESIHTHILPICGYGIVESMTPQWSTVAASEW